MELSKKPCWPRPPKDWEGAVLFTEYGMFVCRSDRWIQVMVAGDLGLYEYSNDRFIAHLPIVLKTPDEWLAELQFKGVSVLDPDGWDRNNFEKSWAEKITIEVMRERLDRSTCRRSFVD